MSLYLEIKEDFYANKIISRNIFSSFLKIIFSQKAWAIICIRIIICEIPLISKISRVICNIVFHIEIGYRVIIGSRLRLHHPKRIIIAQETIIGDDCSIYHGVTLAEKKGKHKGPSIGNNCILGANVVVVGDIIIGDNVRIGPNSVVISNVQPDTIGYGNPLILKEN